ncbi:hypothetical protein QJQ45_028930, partial [Haematococcus lacustris]
MQLHVPSVHLMLYPASLGRDNPVSLLSRGGMARWQTPVASLHLTLTSSLEGRGPQGRLEVAHLSLPVATLSVGTLSLHAGQGKAKLVEGVLGPSPEVGTASWDAEVTREAPLMHLACVEVAVMLPLKQPRQPSSPPASPAQEPCPRACPSASSASLCTPPPACDVKVDVAVGDVSLYAAQHGLESAIRFAAAVQAGLHAAQQCEMEGAECGGNSSMASVYGSEGDPADASASAGPAPQPLAPATRRASLHRITSGWDSQAWSKASGAGGARGHGARLSREWSSSAMLRRGSQVSIASGKLGSIVYEPWKLGSSRAGGKLPGARGQGRGEERAPVIVLLGVVVRQVGVLASCEAQGAAVPLLEARVNSLKLEATILLPAALLLGEAGQAAGVHANATLEPLARGSTAPDSDRYPAGQRGVQARSTSAWQREQEQHPLPQGQDAHMVLGWAGASVDSGPSLHLMCGGELQAQVFNVKRLGWEPVLEPWAWQARYTADLSAPLGANGAQSQLTGHRMALSAPGIMDFTAAPSLVAAATQLSHLASYLGDVLEEQDLTGPGPPLADPGMPPAAAAAAAVTAAAAVDQP